MTMANSITRRGFFPQAAASMFGMPVIVNASALGLAGRAPPSDRIQLAAIGMGGRGSGVFRNLAGRPGVQPIAVCDVQANRLRQFADQGLAVYRDFRDLLARGDVDAVVIATPTHWKPLHTIAAAKAGADVYCEKPMSLTIRDGRAMVRTVNRYGRVFQHGTQQRSSREFRFACEMVRNGRIGQLISATVNVGGPPRECSLPGEPKPDDVDWDMWLGPAPWRPFNSAICMRGCGAWEGYRDYSGGGMTGWGSHHFDIAQWGLNADSTGPVEVIPPNGKDVRLLTYVYANGVKVYHSGRMDEWAVVFEGTEGKVAVNRGKLQTWPENLMHKPTGPDEERLTQSDDHGGNFINCVRTRQKAICDVEIGHRTITVTHLGNIAYELRRRLRWDPDAEQFVDHAEADRLLDRARREPWKL